MDKLGEKFKKFITAEDDFDDEKVAEEEEVEATSAYEQPQQKGILKTDAKMIIFEPRSYEEVSGIVNYLKMQKACVVNIHRLQAEYRQRLVDYLSGAVQGVDGKMQRVSEDVFLVTPRSIGVNSAVEQETAE